MRLTLMILTLILPVTAVARSSPDGTNWGSIRKDRMACHAAT